MGAGQSSNGQESTQQTGQDKKVSYYELLSVDRQASDDEIKKAYRRRALELHPDRNYGDVERTTKLFAEVQVAYEVLSDPQERAWYDSHEEAILNDVQVGEGGNEQYEHNIGITTAEEITRLFRKFNGNVEFSDSPSGFFGFLRDTFETLAKEEEAASAREGLTIPEYPSFGHKDDKHEDVVRAFYGAWSSFSTNKTFAWRDRYRTADAQDRRMRRMIEKENKRFRSDGIHEFNDAVRALVAFVKKRDPRYKPNTQTESERQQILRDAAKAQAARMRAANEAKLDDVVPEWTKTREPEDMDEETEDDESEEEQFECVACRKTFKSEKQFEAHERSKKHIKAVFALRRKLQKEGQTLDLDGEESADGENGNDWDLIEHEHNEHQAEGDSDKEIDAKSEQVKSGDVETSATESLNIKLEKMKINEQPQISDRKSPLHVEENSDISSESEFELEDQESQTNDIDTIHDEEKSRKQPPKMGKAAQKRAKKAAQQAGENDDGSSNKCATCKATFSSRTRLFQHIKDFNHGTTIGKPKGKKGKGR